MSFKLCSFVVMYLGLGLLILSSFMGDRKEKYDLVGRFVTAIGGILVAIAYLF